MEYLGYAAALIGASVMFGLFLGIAGVIFTVIMNFVDPF
jgi:uncharacterized membrane protein (DUF485 family)